MASFLRVNDAIYSSEDCDVRVDNAPLTPAGNPWNVVSLDFEESRERKLVTPFRKSGRPRGHTRGRYKVDSVSLKILVAQGVELQQYLTPQGAGSYGDARFTLTLTVSTPGVIGSVPITYVVSGCKWKSGKNSFEDGVDELVTEVALDALDITTNGMKLWSTVAGPTA